MTMTKASTRGRQQRRIMRAFKLDEVSAVDKPAQEGAVSTIMKRRTPSYGGLVDAIVKQYLAAGDIELFANKAIAKSAGSEAAQPMQPYLVALETSLRSIVGDGSLTDGRKLEMLRKSASDFLAAAKVDMPDVAAHLRGSLNGDNKDMTTVAQLKKQMDALGSKVDRVFTILEKRAASKRQDDDTDDGDMLRAQKRGATKRVDKADDDESAAVERLRTLLNGGRTAKADGEMEDYAMEPMAAKADEEEFFESDDEDMEKQDEDVEEGKPTTEGAEEDTIAAGDTRPIGGGAGGKRRAAKRVRIGDDDTITIEGITIRKSRVEDPAVFAVLKSQQAKLDAVSKQAAADREERELMEFAKRAEEDLKHLPGTVEDKAFLLKRLANNEELDADDRALLTKMLRAGDRAVSTAFNTVGTSVGKGLHRSASGGFTKRVNEIRARDNCSNQEAMRKARREFPDEFSELQGH